MVGFCHLTDSHHNHHGQKPTMVGTCHGGNMLGNHPDHHIIITTSSSSIFTIILTPPLRIIYKVLTNSYQKLDEVPKKQAANLSPNQKSKKDQLRFAASQIRTLSLSISVKIAKLGACLNGLRSLWKSASDRVDVVIKTHPFAFVSMTHHHSWK